MKTIIFFILIVLCSASADAQVIFHPRVQIEFEKTVYVKQLYKATEPEWYERIKDRLPETQLTYFDFIGDTTKSIYRPGKEAPYDPRSFYQGLADKNVVYNDYTRKRTIAQKAVFEEVFLVDDVLPPIQWKLTADTRNIAGFECRKAIGITKDSIAVFAFYTDEILVNGGPESAHGLPGMILGMGVPRLHTTWFATKVEVNGVNMNAVAPAKSGKKINRDSMIKSIDDAMKNWGTYGKNLRWNFII
jgi:GLPGLI family protein